VLDFIIFLTISTKKKFYLSFSDIFPPFLILQKKISGNIFLFSSSFHDIFQKFML